MASQLDTNPCDRGPSLADQTGLHAELPAAPDRFDGASWRHFRVPENQNEPFCSHRIHFRISTGRAPYCSKKRIPRFFRPLLGFFGRAPYCSNSAQARKMLSQRPRGRFLSIAKFSGIAVCGTCSVTPHPPLPPQGWLPFGRPQKPPQEGTFKRDISVSSKSMVQHSEIRKVADVPRKPFLARPCVVA